MKPSHKGYAAPWSSRKETAGLTWAFVIFLLNVPGHAELMLNQTRHLVQQLIQLTLVLLGVVAPAGPSRTAPVRRPAAIAQSAPRYISIAKTASLSTPERFALAPAVADPHSMVLRMQPALFSLKYVFEGIAIFQNQPCRNARVSVRVVRGDDSVTHDVVTGADGSYHLQVDVLAAEKDAVDWTLQAYSPDFQKAEMAGRLIAQRLEDPENTPIVIRNPIEFVVARAK